jgi:uncharacterized protein YkwD
MVGWLRKLSVLVALSAVAVVVVPAAPARHAGRNVSLTTLEQGVLADINAFRAQHGLGALTISPALTDAARQHSRSMATAGYFSHDSADGGVFWRRIQTYYPQGSRGYWSVGENLLWSSPDVDAPGALQLWENSPPHRENLLTARWREIGISAIHVGSAPGTYGNAPVTIITTDFGVRR